MLHMLHARGAQLWITTSDPFAVLPQELCERGY